MIQRLSKNLSIKMLLIIVGIYLLAVLQDFIYSQLKSTGFYLSESALYNLYWVFFVPILFFYTKLLWFFGKLSVGYKALSAILIAVILSIIHTVVFTGFFTTVSSIVYDQPHRYVTMLKTVFSNQFYLSVIIYAVFPFILSRKQDSPELEKYGTNQLMLKDGLVTEKVATNKIIYIKTDRPYIAIVTSEKRYLQNSSLDAMIKNLQVNVFIRVHRSVIINKNQVVSLKSRKNGDFDAIMANGDEVRLSRHYREAWEMLLHKA